jgi:VanZ family protein
MVELLAPLFYSLGTNYMHSFRFAKLWLVLGWMLVALIVVLSLLPKPPELIGFEQSDKLSDIIAYMTLMLWFANIYAQRPYQLRLALGFFAMGVGLELLQGLTGYRTFKYADIISNGIGILLALYLAKTRLATCLLHLDNLLVRAN